MSSNSPEPKNAAAPNLGDHEVQGRIVKSEDLLRGDREVLVLHHGELYRLRETRSGKLILTK